MEAPDLPADDLARVLIEGTSDGVVGFDRARRVTVWNPALARLTGIEAGAALGRDAFEVLPWLRAAGGQRRVRATLAGASPVGRRRTYRVPGSGREGLLEARFHPIRAADGRVVGGLALIRDVAAAGDGHAGAAEALREREARLRGVIDNLPGVVWRRVRHPDGRLSFPYYSANGERIHGYPSAEIMADPGLPARMIHPDDRARWQAAIEESAAHLIRFACDFRVLTAWGRQRWFRAIATPQRLDDGGVVWDGITLDVTELKETEARLRAVVENLPGTVWRRVRHPDGRLSYPYYSANAERVFGYPAEAIEADAGVILRLIHPDHHAGWRAAIDRSAATLTPFTLDFRVTTGRGEARWFRSMAAPQRLGDGGVAWDGIVLDITELKETEARLRERERQLTEAQQIAGLGDWRWVVGARRETWSRQIYLIFGVDPEGFTPSREAFLAFVHPEDRGAIDAALRRAIAARGNYGCEYRIRRPDGEIRHVRSEGRCELDEATGEIRAVFGISQDVTEKRRAEALLQQAKEEAERYARFLRTALENISEGLALYGPDGGLVVCNDTYRRLYRDSADLLVPGVRFEDLVRVRAERGLAPEARGRVAEWLRERMAGFWNPSGPVEREFPDGSWWQFSEQRSRDGGIAQVATDITPLKRREAELRASEQRFRDFAESASDWLWEMDADLRFTYFSPRFREVCGKGPEGLLGRRREEVRSDAGDADWAAHLADLAARRAFRDFAYPFTNGRGERRICQVSGKPLFDGRGTFLGYRGTARDITERVEAEERIRHLARHDVLTGLPNRVLFADRLEQALAAARRDGAAVAVLCLDLNDFKGVNDTLGHAAGDELLRQVARRLQEAVREVDTVARLGGDEFAVIQVGIEGFGAAAALARRVLLRLAEPYSIEGQELHAAASVGITLYPEDGDGQAALLRNADLALYRAKAEGGHAFQFFLPEMNEALQHRRRLEHDLRRALEEGQFALHYQPQVDLATGRVVGVEALLRWPHPERGPIPPGAFVPIAEESGLILPLGRWALREACRQARAWRDAGLPEVRVAVNLSPVQFAQTDVAGEVLRALREAGLPPERLELEITEGTLMHDTEAAILTLGRLHDLGVVLALDDFGTGYSSLGYLRRFPLHRVKIDQTFVRGIGEDQGDAIIAGAIVTLGHALGLRVIAEGVETPRQLGYLWQQGCDHAQGFYFSPPLSAGACAELLAAGSTARPPWVDDRVVEAAPSPARTARVFGSGASL
ncbi:MAG TPA: EAL domain-containing protein [Geminicoccaceae bacterium]|nr:EAL domain-containing protein [Geminicoccaceae bacterium]